MTRRISVAADHAGWQLKDELAELLRGLGFEVIDHGTSGSDSVDYADFAHAVAADVSSNDCELGLLVCGTGLGMSMAANRHPAIRAARCCESFSAGMTRRHNDANILCLGARVVGSGIAAEIVRTFVTTDFEGGRHARRVGKIELESSSSD